MFFDVNHEDPPPLPPNKLYTLIRIKCFLPKYNLSKSTCNYSYRCTCLFRIKVLLSLQVITYSEVHTAGLSAVEQITTTSRRAHHIDGVVVVFMGEWAENTGHCSF